MGSTTAFAVDESLATAAAATNGPSYKLDVRPFESTKARTLDEIGSSSGSNEGILPDLGLAITSSSMEANSFNMQAMTIESTTLNSSADIRCLKKRDKALPCPRCNSFDTKFCYYNNYNVNQPRHFCKGCQRYWTAGGTLRNVAVGAGRRKRKHSSLESESVSEVSSVERHHAQEFSPTRRVPNECGSVGGLSPAEVSNGICSGIGDLAHGKSLLLPFDATPFDTSGNSPSLKVPGSVPNKLIRAKQSVTSQHSSGASRSSHDNREQASVFHEFMRFENPASVSSKYAGHHNLQAMGNSKRETSNVYVHMQRNECGDVDNKLASALPSERQAPSESGCASSLTTQAVSVGVCTNEGKSDAMDSEATKEVENSGNEGFSVNESSHSASKMSCKMAVSECGLALSGFSQCDSGGAATLAPAPLLWKVPLENPAFRTSWGMQPRPLSWGPAAETAPLWVPWGPTASAVDAAKAALIPNVAELLKPQSEPIHKFQTMSCTDMVQKSGVEPDAPSQIRVWVPKTLNIKDVDEAARSSIWSTLGIGDRQGSRVSEQMKEVFQCQAKEVGIGAVQTQYANPAALLHSTTFQETS